MTEWLSARSRPKLVALSLLLVTFLVGGMSGAALNSAVSARELPTLAKDAATPQPGQRARGPHPEHEDRERARRTAWMADLGVTAEQRVAIDSIFEERRRQMDAVLKEQEPRMRAIIEASNQEVANVLTAEQRERLEQRRAEMRQRRGHDAANQRSRERN